MIHHHIRDLTCLNQTDIDEAIYRTDTKIQIAAFIKVEVFVVITIFVLLLQLGHLMKPFAYGFFRHLSRLSYLLVPILISYILGLMGRPAEGYGTADTETVGGFRYLTCVWAIFLLFAYAGFDNLNAFNIEERHERSKLVLQIISQFSLLVLVIYHLPATTNVIPVVCAILVLASKFIWRLFALAHSAGATPRIKTDVTRLINYMNQGDGDGDGDVEVADPATMARFNCLVGPSYTKLKGDTIVYGVTMEMVTSGSQGRLLSSSSKRNMQLKDTCLSFSLFWLLLGKFSNYPLYGINSSSRAKSWRMVRHGLLAEKGAHERVFRVIEIELDFLRDYFHARYIFFYLNGFYWKLISVIALPVMFWWFVQKAINHGELNYLTEHDRFHFSFTKITNTIVISVIVALEAAQVFVFLASRWLKVAYLCFYVKTMDSKSTNCLSRFFLEVIGFFFLGLSSYTRCWKPWKRELDQYSLVQSCTPVLKSTSYLFLQFISIVGIPLSKLGRKQAPKVVLSERVKEAVVLCLQRYETCLKLSNGSESLRRNGLMEMLSNSARNYKNDTEMILVWHIATSVCELHDTSTAYSSNDMQTATELSKYCAYLLFFSSSLLPVPALEAETICDIVVKEATKLFKKPFFGCGKVEDTIKEKLDALIGDEELIGGDCSLLTKGAMLEKSLASFVGDKDKKWKILAEFWAEMILYLAPSNNNEMDHAEKLSRGGEFITQLWALLIHAGIYNRDDIVAPSQQDGNV